MFEFPGDAYLTVSSMSKRDNFLHACFDRTSAGPCHLSFVDLFSHVFKSLAAHYKLEICSAISGLFEIVPVVG